MTYFNRDGTEMSEEEVANMHEKTEKIETWIEDHPILHGIISFFGIGLFCIFHFVMCFLTMIGLFNLFGSKGWEYYHGKRIMWRKLT